jgi:hypothetical protein
MLDKLTQTSDCNSYGSDHLPLLGNRLWDFKVESVTNVAAAHHRA